MQNVKTPMIGDSVFIPFVTGDVSKLGENEKIGYIKGAAMIPFDKINAVYAETKKAKNSDAKIYSVRVDSGDVVKVIRKDDKWLAVS